MKLMTRFTFLIFFTYTLNFLGAAPENNIMTLWDQGLFKASFEEIKTASDKAEFPSNTHVGILYDQGEIYYTADGNQTKIHRMVYKIETEDAIQDWGSVKVTWNPWHQDKPIIKSRIINPDGSIFNFDPSNLLEGQSNGNGEGVYSDDKSLEAPYPHIMIGSIVEEEITTSNKPILSGAGISGHWDLARKNPIMAEHFIIHVAGKKDFHIQVFGSKDIQLAYKETGNERVWETTQTKLFPKEDKETNLPRNVLDYPYIEFSSAPNWSTLGSLYGELIENKIKKSSLKVPNETIVKGSLTQTSINLIRWINKKIRYVGLELGQNSIIPYTPEEILQRGYGDCKDKAIILASFLRQAGYDASVDLLWNGSDDDINPEIPGLDYFNHAIVCVHGTELLWLDPTSDFSCDEQLPYWDQERWSLPAKINSPGLLKTPLVSLDRQKTIETRDYYLKASGKADMVEETVYHGSLDLYYRQKYAFIDNKKAKENLEKYAKDAYEDASLDNFEFSNPRDLDKPFSLTVRIKDAGNTYTADNDATVVIKPQYLFTWLEDALKDKKGKKRIHDFRMDIPLNIQWKNRIHLPFGFTVREIPPQLTKQFGNLNFHREASFSNDILEVNYEWTLEKTQLTPEEFEKTRSALLEDDESLENFDVTLDLKAYTTFTAGQYHDAFDQYKALIEQDPKQVLHLLRYSKALLDAGLGDQAVYYARQATSLAPQDAKAQANLGWILQHDMLGRRFGAGFDRAKALEAYRKAIELDPKDFNIRADYAILLEFNNYGLRYQNKDDLVEALKQYEFIKDDLEKNDMAQNPLLDLWALGRWKDIETQALDLTKLEQKQTYILAALAIEKSPAEALNKLSAKLNIKAKRQVLTDAAQLLISARHYADASFFLRTAAKGADDSVNLEYRANILSKIKIYESEALPITDVQNTFADYYWSLAKSEGKDNGDLNSFMAPSLIKLLKNSSLSNGLYQEWNSLVKAAHSQNLSFSVMLDLTLSLSNLTIQNDQSAGSHVIVKLEGSKFIYCFFLQKNEKNYSITSLSNIPASMVKPLNDLIEQKKVAEAAQWIDWFIGDLKKTEDASAAYLEPLWNSMNHQDIKDLQFIINNIQAYFAQGPEDLLPVQNALLKATSDSEKKAYLFSLFSGNTALKNYQSALKIIEDAKNKALDSELSPLYHAALLSAGKFDSLEAVLKNQLETNPNDQKIQRELLETYILKPNLVAAENLIEKNNIELTASDYNNIAWAELFSDKVSPKALEYAIKSVTLTESKNRPNMHTLAALYAITGRVDEAQKTLMKSITLSPGAEPRSEDWYVLGLIAEGYGFKDLAKSYFMKVTPDTTTPLSPYELAQKRLQLIH